MSVDASVESKTYLFSYRFQDALWTIDIQAANPDEAKGRLSALAYAKLDGELKARLPVAPTSWRKALSRLRLW